MYLYKDGHTLGNLIAQTVHFPLHFAKLCTKRIHLSNPFNYYQITGPFTIMLMVDLREILQCMVTLIEEVGKWVKIGGIVMRVEL